MTIEPRPCKADDLRCWVNVSHRYTLDGDGNPEDFMDSTADDTSDVDEYACRNCGEYWPIETHFNESARKQALEKARAHLNNVSAA